MVFFHLSWVYLSVMLHLVLVVFLLLPCCVYPYNQLYPGISISGVNRIVVSFDFERLNICIVLSSKRVFFRFTFFSAGEIPPELGKLNNLLALDLSDNRLSGEVMCR